MIYQCVLEVEATISVAGVLKNLNVSTSGYYKWKARKPSNKDKDRAKVKAEIIKIYNDSYQIYGAPKITKVLLSRGYSITQRTVGNYMSQIGIKAHYRKKYIKTTINSNFSKNLNNLLKRDFNPESPNSVWCSDITYIWTEKGFVYLTSIMDLYSRMIIAWKLSNNLSTESVVTCINLAKQRRKLSNPVIIHSDRGVQYTSADYYTALGKDITTSYSDKGTPWDNACIESFHALIKREWLSRYRFKHIIEAQVAVFEYIDVFYNRIRIHSTLGYVSPITYELKYNTRNLLDNSKFRLSTLAS